MQQGWPKTFDSEWDGTISPSKNTKRTPPVQDYNTNSSVLASETYSQQYRLLFCANRVIMLEVTLPFSQTNLRPNLVWIAFRVFLVCFSFPSLSRSFLFVLSFSRCFPCGFCSRKVVYAVAARDHNGTRFSLGGNNQRVFFGCTG